MGRYLIKKFLVLIRKSWFLVAFVLLQLIPPYASHGYPWQDFPLVNAAILTHPIKIFSANLFPIFQILPIILLLAIFFFGNRVSRGFSLYVALTYFLVAFLQNISISEKYGLAICVGNVLIFLLLAGFWFWEFLFPKNHFLLQKLPFWSYWPLLLAMLAFWGPINPQSLLPDFNPMHMLTSGSGLSFCMATPLYLAILMTFSGQANLKVWLATSWVGLMMSMGNLVLEFVIYPSYWWIGVLHFPLFILSIVVFLLSVSRIRTEGRMQGLKKID
jgi:hypothetical protein